MRLKIQVFFGVLLLIAQGNCRSTSQIESLSNPNAERVKSPWLSQSFATMQPSREIKIIGGTNVNAEGIQRDPSQARGMDVEALLELFRTKQPVERITTDAEGNKRTTTYSLQDNGGVKSETVTDVKPTLISSPLNGWSFDDSMPSQGSLWNFKKPTETITRTSWSERKWPEIEEHSSWNFDDAFNNPKPTPKDVSTTTTERIWPKFEDRVTSTRAPYVWNFDNFINEFKNKPREEAPTTKIEERVRTVPPLPSLDEFYKQENSTPPTFKLQLENFPIAGLYDPSKKIDNEQLLQNATILMPRLDNSRENNVEIFSSVARPSVGNTKVTTITRTYTVNSPSTVFDWNPSILRKNPDGTTTALQGNPILETIATNTDSRQPAREIYEPKHFRFAITNSRSSTPTPTPSLKSTPKPVNTPNPIDNFLAKLDLSTDDIILENGRLVKQIIDSAGRILTVDFTLSTVKQENDAQERMVQSPMK